MTDNTPYGKATNTIDGLGRVVKKDDALDHTTYYQFDSYDRIVHTIWPDNRTIDTQYAAQSSGMFPVVIKNNDKVVGEQCFDGLDRAVSRTVGGRTTTQTYQGTAPKPSKITTPKRGQQRLTYEPVLDYAITNISTTDDDSIYQYDNQTASIVRSQNDYSIQELQYLPSGLVAQESIQIKASPTLTALSTYSMAGKLQSYTDVHGQKHEIQYNSFGRPQQLVQGKLKVTFTYDQTSRPSGTCVEDEETNQNLATRFTYDDFSRQIERTVSNGEETLYRMSQTYNQASLVTTRNLDDGIGNPLQHETFEYNSYGHLILYQCRGSQPPSDEQGNQLQSQSFIFDNFDNLLQVLTTFLDGSQNRMEFTYSKENPTQLISFTNTHPSYQPKIDLVYDENGCLTRDEEGRILEYDSTNHLIVVRHAHGQILSQYRYDTAGKLVCQIVPGQPDTHLYYRGDKLIAITVGDSRVSYLSDGTGYWGQITQQGESIQTQLWAADAHQSILVLLDPKQPDQITRQQYTPYGFGKASSSISFNGQWRDPVTGWYHLGNGYRVYNPVLMRFHTPDTWTPFTSGEVTPMLIA